MVAAAIFPPGHALKSQESARLEAIANLMHLEAKNSGRKLKNLKILSQVGPGGPWSCFGSYTEVQAK